MIHTAAPRTHRRRHGYAGCSRAPSAVGRHSRRHAGFSRPQRTGAVARSRRLSIPRPPWSPDTSVLPHPMQTLGGPRRSREGAKDDALAASSKPRGPWRPQEPVPSDPALDAELRRGSGCELIQRQGAA